ncbi:hypothetical protein RRF57_002597 [Xylaria bambusicola]|uniref:Uncharacterized protein n=1 Tax=Xylaria bambusicola TaxID=326684 RepID=A0AAN7Z1Y6_9PEZI
MSLEARPSGPLTLVGVEVWQRHWDLLAAEIVPETAESGKVKLPAVEGRSGYSGGWSRFR